MANLLIEIGNTALKAAWSEGITIGKTVRYQGEKVYQFIESTVQNEYFDAILVASVRPVSAETEKLLSEKCGKLVILDKNHNPLPSEFGIPDYLGYDRAASIIASRYLFKGKPSMIFDLGTTMSIDFLDETGRYLGGNISPGFRTRFFSINRYSKCLPLVDTPETTKEIGDSTTSSIESGVISGIMFEIEGYINKYPQNVVIFTGGDANYFAKRMKNSIFVVCNLVLVGLAIMTDEYVKKNLD